MSSVVSSPAYMAKLCSRKPCAISRCAELVPFGRTLCDRHEAKIPADLGAAFEEANRAFITAATENDFAAAMRALERGLLTERRIRLAIEAGEVRDA